MLQLLFYFNEITIFSLRCQSLLQIKWSYFPAMADHLPVINVPVLLTRTCHDFLPLSV
jgi:hypothetical protein